MSLMVSVRRRARGLLRRSSHQVSLRRAEAALGELAHVDHPAAQSVAAAVGKAIRRDPGAQGADRAARIDAHRVALLADERPLDPDDLDDGASPKSIGEAARGTSHKDWGLLQLLLAQELRPGKCLELGTSLGISSSYFGSGLAIAGGGELVTFEISKARAVVAQDTWATLGVEHVRLVNEPFDPASSDLAAIAPIDVAFLDAHHEHLATIDFADVVIEHLSPAGVILYDDIRHSAGMHQAWDELIADERVAASVDLGKVGLCLYGPRSGDEALHVSVPSTLQGAARLQPR